MSKASEHRVYFLLQSVSHRLKKKADQLAMEAGGMTTAQSAVLNIIIEEGQASQAQIAKRLSQRESATTTMVARLESAKYVTKVRSKDDRRSWVLKPTQTGRNALKKMSSALSEINVLLDEAVSASEMDDFADSLRSVLSALDAPKR